MAKPLNRLCTLELTILEATFARDADLLGKQDPFIKFHFGGKSYETEVKDGAGKHAVWNQEFTLRDIGSQVAAAASLVLEAFDKDAASSEFLGRIEPITLASLAGLEGPVTHDVAIKGPENAKAGNIRFRSLLRWVPPSLMEPGCMLRLVVKSATLAAGGDALGKQDPFIKFKY